MARRHISQREAHRLDKRVTELMREREQNARAWSRDWVGGVHIGSIHTHDQAVAWIQTARRLGRPVVVTLDSDNAVMFHAVKF